MVWVYLILGLLVLMASAEILIRGAVAVSEKVKIPPVIIGLTVVAFGTSAPELVVSLKGAISGSVGISIGNVVGSNISNILLILGVSALIAPIHPAYKKTSKILKNNMFFIISALSLAGIILFRECICRFDGLILLALMGLFLYNSFVKIKVARSEVKELEEELEGFETLSGKPIIISIVFIILGLLGLTYGAEILVNSAVEIAHYFGVSDEVIGLTIVAVGTSLPELAAAVAASLKKETSVALGNVVGSNVFNILLILGLTALVSPLSIPKQIANFDIWILVVVTLLFMGIFTYNKKFSKWNGFLFILMYGFYIYSQYVMNA